MEKMLRHLLVTCMVVVLLYPVLTKAQGAVQTDVPALRDVYAHDFYIGCLLSYRNIGFATDPYVPGQSPVATPQGGDLIKYHMNSMTPGNNMKPQYTVDISASAAAYVRAADKEYADTHPVVRFNGDMIAQLNWARRQGFTFRGHTLVWHSQTPATFFRSGYTSTGPRLSAEKMSERLDNYIKEVIRLLHEGWPGLLTAMDVVNEAVKDDGTDRTTDSEWYLTFGDNSYLLKAFELTRKHTLAYDESQMKLYYNDYNTHVVSKANGIVRICTPIFQAGYLDGIGMQEHDASTSPTAGQWIASYNKFAPICHEMAVTELDVTTGSATPSAAVLTTQANQYAQLFKCFVERSYFSGRGKIISVSKDGLNDQYTFKANQASSLWDSRNQCKPAFYAVVDVGVYYNKLDSMVTLTDTLQENNYTADSWAKLATALVAAKGARAQNYSTVLPAASSLATAANNLEVALAGLVASTSRIALDGERTLSFVLGQNYPNPFNATTRIEYVTATAGEISLSVHNLRGEEVALLCKGMQQPGTHAVMFDAGALPAGIYWYRLQTAARRETKRLTLIK